MEPCPFCGAGGMRLRPSVHWTGKRSILLKMEIHHWCEGDASFLKVWGETEEEAVANWNRRVGPGLANWRAEPTPPHILASALQDCVHKDIGNGRPANLAAIEKAKRDGIKEGIRLAQDELSKPGVVSQLAPDAREEAESGGEGAEVVEYGKWFRVRAIGACLRLLGERGSE